MPVHIHGNPWSEVHAADGYPLRCEWSALGTERQMRSIEIAPARGIIVDHIDYQFGIRAGLTEYALPRERLDQTQRVGGMLHPRGLETVG
jgi:hypothetical protein